MRERVEQRLGGVLVGAVAGVDHAPPIHPGAASRCGAPEAWCRTTTASAPIASSVSAVSLRLSPLDTLDPLAEKLMTSADSRLAAASNEIRVRVESSKNRLTTVRPRSVGSFLIGRSASRGQLARRCRGRAGRRRGSGRRRRAGAASSSSPPLAGPVGLGRAEVSTASRPSSPRPAADPHRLAQRGGQVLADVVGADRQLAVAAVDQDGELDGARPAEVVERVERGADGAAGEQHVVDQHDHPAVDALGGQLGAARARGRGAAAGRRGTSSRRGSRPAPGAPSTCAMRRGEPAGQRDAAGGDAEQDQVVGALGAFEDLVRDPGQGPGDVAGSRTILAAAGSQPVAPPPAPPAASRVASPVARWLHGFTGGRARTMLRSRADAMRRRPPSPPHRTGLKGRLDGREDISADRSGLPAALGHAPSFARRPRRKRSADRRRLSCQLRRRLARAGDGVAIGGRRASDGGRAAGARHATPSLADRGNGSATGAVAPRTIGSSWTRGESRFEYFTIPGVFGHHPQQR